MDNNEKNIMDNIGLKTFILLCLISTCAFTYSINFPLARFTITLLFSLLNDKAIPSTKMTTSYYYIYNLFVHLSF